MQKNSFFLKPLHPLQTCWSETAQKLIASSLIIVHLYRHPSLLFASMSLFTTALTLQSHCILYIRCILQKLFASFSATLHPLWTLFIHCGLTASFRTILRALSTLYILCKQCANLALAACNLQALGILLLKNTLLSWCTLTLSYSRICTLHILHKWSNWTLFLAGSSSAPSSTRCPVKNWRASFPLACSRPAVGRRRKPTWSRTWSATTSRFSVWVPSFLKCCLSHPTAG